MEKYRELPLTQKGGLHLRERRFSETINRLQEDAYSGSYKYAAKRVPRNHNLHREQTLAKTGLTWHRPTTHLNRDAMLFRTPPEDTAQAAGRLEARNGPLEPGHP